MKEIVEIARWYQMGMYPFWIGEDMQSKNVDMMTGDEINNKIRDLCLDENEDYFVYHTVHSNNLYFTEVSIQDDMVQFDIKRQDGLNFNACETEVVVFQVEGHVEEQ